MRARTIHCSSPRRAEGFRPSKGSRGYLGGLSWPVLALLPDFLLPYSLMYLEKIYIAVNSLPTQCVNPREFCLSDEFPQACLTRCEGRFARRRPKPQKSRSDERREGKECVRTFRSCWSP